MKSKDQSEVKAKTNVEEVEKVTGLGRFSADRGKDTLRGTGKVRVRTRNSVRDRNNFDDVNVGAHADGREG